MKAIKKYGIALVVFFIVGSKLHSQINVYVFVFPDCPICKYYIPKLHELAKAYEKKFCNFHYIVPSAYLSTTEKKGFKRILKKTCKLRNEYIYTESTDTFYARYNAKITPEVFVERNDKLIVYSGAIDDKYIDVANYKQQTEHFYLKDAIDCGLNNNKVKVERVDPVGCIISR